MTGRVPQILLSAVAPVSKIRARPPLQVDPAGGMCSDPKARS
uniref:Predicted protein n=1 Tax=Hordeum vulgare subsp. vulgare TaxID=112509 RepID=F2EJA9_HORVV|nr:predicted protein [Hordeum vulgare subsp. vulgare]